MNVFRAAWVLPITAPPIRDGWISVDGGLITGVGTSGTLGTRGTPATDLGNVAVLPALVNAHTHLELSYLRGTIPPADRFLAWIRGVMTARACYPDPAAVIIRDAARQAIAEARAAGTGLVGDVSNTLVTVPLLRDARMPARVFYELLGFNAPDPVERVRKARAAADAAAAGADDVRVSLAPHAPYSVSPQLFDAIRRDLDRHPDDISTVHLGESRDEVEFIDCGTGGWRDLLREVGAWTEAWRPAGCSPVKYLSGLGFLDERVMTVHGVHCSTDDLVHLRAVGTTVVSCPRSNRYVGVGDPPIDAFYAAGIQVAFGTDSLASVENLNMFGELAAARRLAPRVSARRLIESATLSGARALGFGGRFGSLEAGKSAALLAVRTPHAVGDVEEYLLSGIEPEAIRWLEGS